LTGGSLVRPVLRNELLVGPPAQSYLAPVELVAKFHSLYVSAVVLVPVQYGQPKLPADVIRLNSTWPPGPRLASGAPASGP
jgi:hypothetical protein